MGMATPDSSPTAPWNGVYCVRMKVNGTWQTVWTDGEWDDTSSATTSSTFVIEPEAVNTNLKLVKLPPPPAVDLFWDVEHPVAPQRPMRHQCRGHRWREYIMRRAPRKRAVITTRPVAPARRSDHHAPQATKATPSGV